MTVDPAWLRQRYLVDRAPVADIADEAGVDLSTIHNTRRAANIPRRGKAEARTVVALDRNWLAARRSEGMSWHAIAREAGIDRSSVVWQAAGYGLYDLTEDPVRYRRAVSAAAKYRRGWSLARIATAVGADRRQVTLWLRALGVEIRPAGRRSNQPES